MKEHKYLACIIMLSLFAVSCAKEEEGTLTPVENTDVPVCLTPISFTAGIENGNTKVAINKTGEVYKVAWEGDESIAVFDGSNEVPYKFDATTAGASTSFEGKAAAGADSYYAVYPYDSGIRWSESKFSIKIPNVQEAVMGSFDPKAAFYVATSTGVDAKLAFKAAFALLEVEVDLDNVVGIVADNTSFNLSGSFLTTTSGSLSNGTGDKYKTVTLCKKDKSILEKGVYYIVVRYPGSNKYENFSITYITSSGVYAKRTSPIDVTKEHIARNQIMALGGIDDEAYIKEPVDRYRLYQDGYNLTVAGGTYNIEKNGSATLLTNGTDITTGTLSSGVFFLVSEGTYTNTSAVAINEKNVVIIGSDPEKRAVVTMSDGFRLQSGSIVFDGIKLHTSSGYSRAYLFSNTGATKSFDKLTLSRCAVIGEYSKYIYGSTVAEHAVNSIVIDACLIETTGSMTTVISPTNSNSLIQSFSGFTFTNNVVFYSGDGNLPMQIFTYANATPPPGDWNNEINICNNLFYNVATTDGLYRNHTVKTLKFDDNLFYSSGSLEGNALILRFNSGSNTNYSANKPSAKNNYSYGSIGGHDWVLCADGLMTSGMESISLLGSSPIETADVSTGNFVLTDAFTSAHPGVGPQPMPAPLPVAI